MKEKNKANKMEDLILQNDPLRRAYNTHFQVFIFLNSDSYRALSIIHHTVNSIDLRETASRPLSASFFQHSLHAAHVAYSSPLPSSC